MSCRLDAERPHSRLDAEPPSELAGWTPNDFVAAGRTPAASRAVGWMPNDFIAAGWTPNDFVAAGWTPSALRAAGWMPNDFIAAGWMPNDFVAAGWMPNDFSSRRLDAERLRSRRLDAECPQELPAGCRAAPRAAPAGRRAALRAAGWMPNDFMSPAGRRCRSELGQPTPSDLRAAGWTPSEIKKIENFPPIPVLQKPYTVMLADIRKKTRLQPINPILGSTDFDPKQNICETRIVYGWASGEYGKAGYRLLHACGDLFVLAASLIHEASCPNVPAQNFGPISQELAMAYIEQRAAEEQESQT